MIGRAGIAGAVATMVLAIIPGVAQAASVRIIDPDGASHTLDLAQLEGEEDVRDRDYEVGGATRTVTGFSLARILSLGGVGQTEWTSATIDGSLEVDEDDTFSDGPAVVYRDGNESVFIRPAGPGDAEVRQGGTIEIEAFKAEVDLEIQPQEPKVEAGESQTFSVASSGSVPASELSFRWTAAGQGTQTGRSVSFRFPEAGRFPVSVTALADGDVVGQQGTFVTAGEPKRSKEDRPGGGKNQDDDAPVSGAFDGGDGTGAGLGNGRGSGDGPGAPGSEDETAGSTPDGETEDVLGELLAGVGPPQEAAGEEGSAREGTPVESGQAIPGVLIGAVSVLLIYGLGAGRELGVRLRKAGA